MLLGPIFQVELVAAARQGRQYLVRVIYALIILFVLWVSYSSMSQMQRISGGDAPSISEVAQMATTFFVAFSWVQLLGIIAIAPAMAVGTIATERERRTIEYLFATDLSNFEIVVGKTFARLLIVGQLVLVSLPILFIFRLLGGIPANLLAGSFISAASTALFLTALSVCVSVWSPRSRDAVMRVYRLLAVLLIVPGILSAMLLMVQVQLQQRSAVIEGLQAGLTFVLSLNPVVVLGQSMRSVFAAGVAFDFEPVLKMAAWQVGFSVALIALATHAVRRVHLRDAGRGDAKQQRKLERRRGMETFRWRPELSENGMLWKEAFAPSAKTKLGVLGSFANAIIVVIALGLTAYFFICAKFEILDFNPEAYYIFMAMTTGLLGTGLLLTLAGRSAGLVTLEKERDCWISLLSTPLTGAEIMRAKLLGNLYSARWGFALLMVVWALAATFDVRFLLMLPLLALSFTLAALFVSQVGLHYSLVSSTSLRAMGYTLATVFFVGGGYLFCCCSVAAVGAHNGMDDEAAAIGMAPCIPYLLVAPVIYFMEDMNLRGESEFAVAYIAGIIFYAFANLLLASDLAHSFDRRAGRTVERSEAALGGLA
ncbi:ABC transporter permease [Lacipirellula parvula]|uniref:ABC-2 family transporter protein n=1 Tax=Lacipirellula parvula TaxID=2650471 RepID=A0A5K7XGP0_9BACT|nr:ABC transporter permease subunit [Lacipirellula parvula]BBO34091.1 hypothetical protein PLANPX_3703 [Lacipirellula parvula]